MPSDKKYRRPKCVCGAPLNRETGLCPHRCDLYARPATRIRIEQKGRAAEPDKLLSSREAREGMRATGIPPLNTCPIIM